jgi:alkyl hydroperoxide reductase subunit D
MLQALEALRQSLPEVAKDIKLNLQTVLTDSTLSVEQRWGVAATSALALGNVTLRNATLADAKAVAPHGVLDDAAAAAVLMAMNNVYYRSRHMIGKATYETKPPKLRMGRLGQPASDKQTFELFALAVSCINGCQVCIASHEKTVTTHGISEDQVNDVLRIAAVFAGAATALHSIDMH